MSFTKKIAPHIEAELNLSARSLSPTLAFKHLENAHVLGQQSTYWHVKVHWAMLVWGMRQKDSGEVLGQSIRLLGAALLTVFQLVPEGNTGGSNVSMIKPMTISQEHANIIANAQQTPP